MGVLERAGSGGLGSPRRLSLRPGPAFGEDLARGKKKQRPKARAYVRGTHWLGSLENSP